VLGNRSDKVLWVDVEEQRIVRTEENVREVRLVSLLSFLPNTRASVTSQSPSSTRAHIRFHPQTNEALFSHNGSLLFTAVEGQAQITAFPSADPVYSINMSGKTSIQSLDLDPRGRCVFPPFRRASGSNTDRGCDTRNRYLASGGNDTTLTLWETEEWTCTAASGVHECVFSHSHQPQTIPSSLRPCPVASHPLHLSPPLP
jgi:hypothetical protein